MSTYQAIKVDGVPELMESLDVVAGLATRHGKHDRFTEQLFHELGAMVESQTRRRIADEKESPDGRPWPKWTPKYAKTRESQHSLLSNEGKLLDSIDYQVDRTRQRVEIGDVKGGSNVEYAAVHQFGFAGCVEVSAHIRIIKQAFGRQLKFPVAVNVKAHKIYQEIKARPYLGISAKNEQELLVQIDNWLERTLRRA